MACHTLHCAHSAQAVNADWDQLQSLVRKRKQLLSEAHEIHVFIRDASETLDRIREKDAVLSSDDYGRDVAGVEALLRKHDGVQRDLIAVGESVAAHIGEASRLIGAYADRVADVKSKKGQVEQAWEALQQKAGRRKKKLDDALNLQRFLVEFRDSVSWITDVSAAIRAEDLATVADVPAAESLLERHKERRDEIDARQDSFSRVHSTAARLCDGGHYAAGELQSSAAKLKSEQTALDVLWAERNGEFEECLKVRQFHRDAAATEAWIQSNSGFVLAQDLGASLDSVDQLMKKLEDFEKSVAARSEKAKVLDSFAQTLAASARSPAMRRAIGKK